MLTKRVVVCLDVKDGRVVKGVRFRDLRELGDPAALAERYEAEGADEVVFLDISASAEGRRTLLEVVRRTAERLFIPLTVGGGIGTVDDIDRVLRAGADKVSVNTAAVRTPELMTAAARRFGAQCVVASIDAALEPVPSAEKPRHKAASSDEPESEPGLYRVYTHGGRTPTDLDAVDWARRCSRLGAGEIMLTSIDRDGARTGYELRLTRAVVDAVSVPVIASGGAGEAEHLRAALEEAGADAALVAGILHDGETTVGALKAALARSGVPVRETAPTTTGP